MTNGWGGSDPVQVTDAASYELGTEYVANQQITISAVRVWSGVSPGSLSGRTGRIWSTAGFQLGTATMPMSLPSGWATYNLNSPVTINAAQHFVVSFGTGGNYGAGAHYLDSGVNSSDGALTAVAASSSAHGNGIFNTSVGSYPASTNAANYFYGIDVVYTLGSGSNQPPVITGFTVTAVGALATATLNATDPDNDLVGGQYAFDWGDGVRTLNLPSGSATHTYTTSGDYAVLGWVTDTGGLSTYGAAPVEIDIAPAGVSGVNSNSIINALSSHAVATGFFDRFAGHEPASAPGSGLSGAVWVDTGPDPIPSRSGLATVNAKLLMNVRLYTNMKPAAEPEERDAIDPSLVKAVDALMSAYAGAFTLDGLIEEVDLLGMAGGTALGVKYGYITIGSTLYRVATITVPCIVGDVWQEVP